MAAFALRSYAAALMLRHPAHLVSFGFGSGLAPVAPGTFGTLFGWLVFAIVARRWPQALEPGALAITLIIALVIGSVCAHRTGQALGVPDHGSIVIDEIVAIYLVLAFLPMTFAWHLAGFVAFRVFDIWKPAPIRQLDRRFKTGFGVMADDLVAAGYALLVLAIAKALIG